MNEVYCYGKLAKLLDERLKVREVEHQNFKACSIAKRYDLRMKWTKEFLQEFKLIAVKEDVKPEVEPEAEVEPGPEAKPATDCEKPARLESEYRPPGESEPTADKDIPDNIDFTGGGE